MSMVSAQNFLKVGNIQMFTFNSADNTSAGDPIDQSGVTVNGVNFGGTLVPSKLGDGFQFDGSADYVDSNLTSEVVVSDAQPTFTYAFWFNLTAITGNDYIGAAALSSGDFDRIRVWTTDPDLHSELRGGAASTDCDSSFAPGIGHDHLWMVTFNESGIYQYVNNTLLNFCPKTWNNPVEPTFSLFIAARNNAGTADSFYGGVVDEWSVWNITLNSTQRDALWNNGDGLNYTDWDDGGDLVLPTITSYNLTSDGGCIVWDVDKQNFCNTTDSTPTINIITDEVAVCRISTQVGHGNVNFSTMNSTNDCSTTNATNHICSGPAADAMIAGHNNATIACEDLAHNQNSTSTSGFLATRLARIITGTVTLDGATAVDNATVVLIDQSDNSKITNVSTNSTGDFEVVSFDDSLTFMTCAYDPVNATRDGDVKPHITIP